MLKVIRSTVSKILHPNFKQGDNIILPFIRRYSYENCKPVPKPEDLPKYEITNDEKDWQYVERLMPFTYIPEIIEKDEYPSGWVPQKIDPNLPYAVKRTRNGMLPIHLKLTHRYMRRITRVSQIHGDIWKLAADLQKYLEKIEHKKICVKVHELCGTVYVHGDHVSNSKVWALKNNL